MAAKEVKVSKLPKCQLHPDVDAAYDFSAPREGGVWLYGCERCFKTMGGRLGVGLGQKLVLKGAS